MSTNRTSTADPKSDTAAIRDDLASLKADVAALISDVAQRGTERATYAAHAAGAKAQELGYKLNEYSLMKGDDALPAASEEDVFKLLDSSCVEAPPREDTGDTVDQTRR